MGQLVGLPQLVQQVLLLHGCGSLLLLQHRHLPLQVEQGAVLVPGVLVRLVALGLQGQLLVVDAADGGLTILVLLSDGLELPLLLRDLLLQAGVLLLELGEHLLPLGLVAGQVPAQFLQFGHGLPGSLGLRLQGGQTHIQFGNGLAQSRGLLLGFTLAFGLALCLGPQGGGGSLQGLHPGTGGTGIRLDLGGTGLELFQLILLVGPLLLQIGQLGIQMV